MAHPADSRGARQMEESMKAAIMVPGADGGRWDVRDLQRPVVTAGHVLVRAHASSLNRAEFRRLHAMRVRPGKAVPEARTGIRPGDRVMGRCAGGFAEFALLDAREVMPLPNACRGKRRPASQLSLWWSMMRC